MSRPHSPRRQWQFAPDAAYYSPFVPPVLVWRRVFLSGSAQFKDKDVPCQSLYGTHAWEYNPAMNISEAIKTMRAVRQYTERNVPDQVVTTILRAGQWAGSAKNVQPWKFIVIRNRDTLQRLARCGSYASHLKEAPCAIVVVTEA